MSAAMTEGGGLRRWGVGWYPSASGSPEAYPATPAEMVRHTDSATSQLAGLGVGPDDIVVMVARGSETVQFSPWETACNRLGAVYAVVDGFRVDAHRLKAYVTQFQPKAVLGIVEDVVIALRDAGVSCVELLAPVPIVAARPRALRLLRDDGLQPLLWLHAGPAVGVECSPGEGAHIDPTWAPTIVDGRLAVHPSDDQELGSEPIPTGLFAQLATDPCPCGISMPRLRLTAVPDIAD